MKRLARAAALLSLALSAACLDPSEGGHLVPKTADEDPGLPQVTLNGSTLHLETFGDPARPVVVMLHGGPGGDYRGLLRLRDAVDGRRLEDAHLVVFWDQRGAGLSQRHDPEDVTLAAYDADLDAVVDRFSPGRPVVLVGHSWGGMFAAQYIAKHPAKVAGAVLMEPGPLTGALYDEVKGQLFDFDVTSEWLNDATWADRVLSPDDHVRADYLRLLGMFGDAQPNFGKPEHDKMKVWRFGAVASDRISAEGMKDGKPTWDFTTGAGAFAPKVLVQASVDNPLTGVAFQERQARFYANAEVVVVPGGHHHPWTHPAETLRPVLRYLDAIGF